MQHLLNGVSKFQREVFPRERALFEQLAQGQSPSALFVTCADSRVVPSLITQTRPGELFICRNAGNMIPAYGEVHGGVSATIEYAVGVLNIRHIVVCGHSDCGAVKALLSPEKLEGLPTVKSWLAHGEAARRVVMDNFNGHNLTEDALLRLLTEENVVAQVDHLRTHPVVASQLARGALQIHGWVYDIRTGSVDVWDRTNGRFVAAQEYTSSRAQDAGNARPEIVRRTFAALQEVANHE